MILTVRLITENGWEYTQAVEGSTLDPEGAVELASLAVGIPMRQIRDAVVNDGRGFVCAVPGHELTNNYYDRSDDD